jgi:hypothetical protein
MQFDEIIANPLYQLNEAAAAQAADPLPVVLREKPLALIRTTRDQSR